jgi:hypothetical protein
MMSDLLEELTVILVAKVRERLPVSKRGAQKYNMER